MRAGGERRGNARDRAARRRWLLEHFDPDLGPTVARCALHLSDTCHQYVDDTTLTVDRIEPGGTYRRGNIQPACRPCQNTQGALITREARHQWLAWAKEADMLGIDWDGVA